MVNNYTLLLVPFGSTPLWSHTERLQRTVFPVSLLDILHKENSGVEKTWPICLLILEQETYGIPPFLGGTQGFQTDSRNCSSS